MDNPIFEPDNAWAWQYSTKLYPSDSSKYPQETKTFMKPMPPTIEHNPDRLNNVGPIFSPAFVHDVASTYRGEMTTPSAYAVAEEYYYAFDPQIPEYDNSTTYPDEVSHAAELHLRKKDLVNSNYDVSIPFSSKRGGTNVHNHMGNAVSHVFDNSPEHQQPPLSLHSSFLHAE